MNLVLAMDCGTFLYQVWETETEYLCQCVHVPTLQTLWEGRGSTPLEAMEEGAREAWRTLS